MITITSQAIDKFLADSRRYLAAENPVFFKRATGSRPVSHAKTRQPACVPVRWETRSSL